MRTHPVRFDVSRPKGTRRGYVDFHPMFTIDDLGIAAAELGSDGEWLACNPQLLTLLGLSQGEVSAFAFKELFRPSDPQKDHIDYRRMLEGDVLSYSCTGTIVRKTGSSFPARVVFSAIRDRATDELKAILAVVDDMTALQNAEQAFLEAESARRELARQLINDQENERTRIARELHDDISQSLAILSIEFLRADKPVSGMPGKRHASVTDLCEKLRDVANRVSHLSHQLHSSKLAYLGLAAAVQSNCREFSDQHKIVVDCICNGVPAELDNRLAVAVLRIVQEALHNVAKHSHAKSVHVSMQGHSTHLCLTIEDDGIGFDLREGRLAGGLGLISMRERVHLAGGDFRISSTPSKGTSIFVHLPLKRGMGRTA